MSEEDDSVYIPIPHYPPFKLRSSLIDKDPVIWVHLLEAYILLFNLLLDSNAVKLNVKSQQQLQLFLKVFLYETSEEKTKIFSLGAINPDIRANTATLRSYVFQLIKSYSLVRFSLPGESVWHFVSIYVEHNATVVRGLIDGSFKSKLNDNKKSGNISSIGPLQRHLESLISNGKFTDTDLNNLSLILGQHTSNVVSTTTFSLSGGSRTKNVSKKQSSSLQFAENFVNQEWVELLEKLYVNGRSVHASVVKQVMIVSLISLSTAKLLKVAMDLGVTGIKTLKLYPLFSTIIISDAYKHFVPNLEERLPFLRTIRFENDDHADDLSAVDLSSVNEENIFMLIDLFPELTQEKARLILHNNDDNVERVTHMLLEDPSIIHSTNLKKPNKPKKKPITKINLPKSKKPSVVAKRSVYDDDEISRGDFSKSSVIFGKKSSQAVGDLSEELKKKTLSAALRLMYESDEDEPDDTYDDQEKTVGSALEDSSNKKKAGRGNLAVYEDGRESSPAPSNGAVDPKELHLFSIFKTKGEEAFGKAARKSSDRQSLKKETSWSDEQIEGWLRMLMKSPRRFKILEESFFFGGSPNRPQKKIEEESRESTPVAESSRPESKTPQQNKRSQARNEKNKASRANHNRKSQQSKKARAELAGMQ